MSKHSDKLYYNPPYHGYLLSEKDASLLLGILHRSIPVETESYKDENEDYHERYRTKKSGDFRFRNVSGKEIDTMYAFEKSIQEGEQQDE